MRKVKVYTDPWKKTDLMDTAELLVINPIPKGEHYYTGEQHRPENMVSVKVKFSDGTIADNVLIDKTDIIEESVITTKFESFNND